DLDGGEDRARGLSVLANGLISDAALIERIRREDAVHLHNGRIGFTGEEIDVVGEVEPGGGARRRIARRRIEVLRLDVVVTEREVVLRADVRINAAEVEIALRLEDQIAERTRIVVVGALEEVRDVRGGWRAGVDDAGRSVGRR